MRPYRNESLMEEIRATEAELEEMERRRDQRRHSEIRRREDELQDLRRRQDETARRQEARLYAQATNYGSSPASYERRSVYMEESSYHMERERRASSRQHVPGGTNMSRHSGYDSAGMERPSARQILRQSSYDHAERERGSATRQFPTNTPGHSTYASTERETPASAARQVPANTFTPNNPRSQHQHQEGSSTIDVEGLTRRLDNLATSGDPVFSHDIRPQTGPSVSSAADREDAAARPNARRTGAWVGSLNENANFEAWEEGSIANAGVLRRRASGPGPGPAGLGTAAAAAGCAMPDSNTRSLRGGGGPAPPPTNKPASTAVAELPFPVFDRCAWTALRARDRSLPLPGSAEAFGHPDELDTDVWVGLDNPAVLSVSSRIIAKYLPDLRDVYDRRPGAKFRLKNDDDPYTPRYGVLIALDEGGGFVLQPLSRLRSHRGRLQVDDRTGKFKRHFVDFVRALHGREVRDVDGFRVGMSKTARYFDCSEAVSRCLRTVEARQRSELEAAVDKEACDYMHFAFRYDSKPTFKLAFDAVARQALAGGDVEDFLRDVPNATRDIVRIKVDMLRRNIEDDAIWQRAWNAIDGGHPVPSEPSIR
ncbi:hypothetical protein SLS54_008511 [Diplodia seriata]